MEITGTITHLIKVLCKTIEEAIIAVDCVPQITQLQDIPRTFEEQPAEISMQVVVIRTYFSR